LNSISTALEAALATPEVREKLDLAGCAAKSAPLAEFANIIRSDIALWAKVVKDAGIPAD
jgi:tripartite-type tricarboxylate transporter receptor subunit TctC